ncbi:zinc finger CCCH domain-containing protein 14 [Sitodiplosis mosellana]|uniref:zinc finger CCCH domain-containing protein 14 n=1 Tax=Sitodiplosis mosellana TaxID=263140 RepID=UPI002443925E|nr:zinc finger CCCH domain-containing protein 14 [Sitodiplosis mosellana]
MDGLGSEVGNKMRSAVKAKLVELGSGTAGYIDDELPDYVMIMVANKRSKEQMIDDLGLFLEENTDTFVSWLHQVLEKLQEVTLPPNVQKSKRKTSESSTTEKRDKKVKPKKRGKTPDKSPVRSTTPPIQSTSTSITDVFADHLIQKAKKVIEPPLSVKKAERNGGTTNDGFDIPTISEIAKKAVGAVVCRKEITELAELQKKIDQAKRQLRHMTDESDDEDFINLGAEKLDFDGELSNNSKEHAIEKAKSNETTAEKVNEAKTHAKITFDETRDTEIGSPSKKQSILNRLGTRGDNEAGKGEQVEKNKNIISLSAHRRMEQAIYVPAHRRTTEQAAIPKRSEPEKIRERSPIKNTDSRRSSRIESRLGRDNQRSRERRDSREPRDLRDHRDTRESRDLREPRDLREKVRQKERDVELRGGRTNRDSSRGINKSEEKLTSATNRMGSKVIVAPAKPEYVEDEIEVPISSVVKVKPRPLIPRSKQASKNLLLRAVAEAQKSTALVKPVAREFKATEKNTKELYTKSFRNKLQKGNIVVEIAADETETIDGTNVDELETAAEEEEEEYVPKSESIDDDAFVYIPQAIHNDGSKDSLGPKTQFVVTLDSLGFPAKKQLPQKDTPRVIKPDAKMDERKRTPITSRIGNRRSAETENENELRKAVEDSSKSSSLKRKRTPIKFDISDRNSEATSEPPKKRRSRSAERRSNENEHRKSPDRDDNRRRDNHSKSRERDSNEFTSKIRTLKTSSQNKYDNLPPLSSAITVTSNENKVAKKERCKFYPSCTRGERCDYYHPTTPCKAFPNCKYGDICLYIHPKCKFDLTCSRLDCNFTHTPVVSAAPPLASHVVPVTNYKKIVTTPLPTLCRFYPNCSNTLCEFYHPKPCKFGKSCTNKVECNFYHFDLPTPTNNTTMPSKNKMKWVASAV